MTAGPRASKLRYKEGDRVMHKPTTMRGSLTEALPPRTRLGTIEEIAYRSNRRGAKVPWLKVKWDGSVFPEWHMTMRIKHADE